MMSWIVVFTIKTSFLRSVEIAFIVISKAQVIYNGKITSETHNQ